MIRSKENSLVYSKSKPHKQLFYLVKPSETATPLSYTRSASQTALPSLHLQTQAEIAERIQNIQRPISKQTQSRALSSELVILRKRCDIQVKNAEKLQNNIEMLRKQIEDMQDIQEDKYSLIGNLRETQQELENKCRDTRARLQDIVWQRSVLINIQKRMKTDQIFYKLQNEKCEAVVKAKLNVVNHQAGADIVTYDSKQKTKLFHKKVLQDFEYSGRRRKDQLTTYGNYLKQLEKEQLHEMEKMQQVNRHELQQGFRQSHDRKALLVHLVLRKMLREKATNLLAENNKLVDSYQQVKVAANITTPQQMASKFLSRDDQYQQLADSVESLQKHLQVAKSRNSVLKRKWHQMTVAVLEQQKQQRDSRQEGRIDPPEISQYTQYLGARLREWTHQNIRKLGIAEEEDEEQKDTCELFRKLCRFIQSHVDSVTGRVYLPLFKKLDMKTDIDEPRGGKPGTKSQSMESSDQDPKSRNNNNPNLSIRDIQIDSDEEWFGELRKKVKASQ